LLSNFWAICTMPFAQKLDIVIGIAPFDPRMRLLWPFISKHRLYWHTSWPSYELPKLLPYPLLYGAAERAWVEFLLNAQKLFFVTENAYNSFTNSVMYSDNYSIVKHSVSNFPHKNTELKDPFKLIFSGRLEQNKGCHKLVELANELKKFDSRFKIYVAGAGDLADQLAGFENIFLLGFLSKPQLERHYRDATCLLVPSLRSPGWEEAFGLSIIEAMSFGVIPLVTDHSGPSEILSEDLPYLIFSEDSYVESIIGFLKSETRYESLRVRVWSLAKKYDAKNIKDRWRL
jgi:glycosyltransferase involved in cell wall biosynthesis